MTIHSEDVVGLSGVALTLVAYFLLQVEVIRSDGFNYSFINAVGSVLIFYAILSAWNLSAAVMEVCWLLMSIYGCLKALIHRKKSRKRQQTLWSKATVLLRK